MAESLSPSRPVSRFVNRKASTTAFRFGWLVPPDIAGILASIRSSIAQRDAMMKQMQTQPAQQGEAFPQLDLATEPPKAPATPPPAP